MTFEVLRGDCLDVMLAMDGESVDAIVCDPPYGLGREPVAAVVLGHWLAGDDYEHRGSGFMGSTWDSFVPGPATWKAASRVLKPGGYMLAFGGSRTFDLLTMAVRLAGFEIRDEVLALGDLGPRLDWIYGSGFPKSLDVGKHVDRAATVADREHVGAWHGWGTALKPAHEPILVARKPLRRGTVARQVLDTGTGAMNVGACQVEFRGAEDEEESKSKNAHGQRGAGPTHNSVYGEFARDRDDYDAAGRWPANVALVHSEACRRVGTVVVAGDPRVELEGARPGHFADVGSGNGSPEPNAAVYGEEVVDAYQCAPGCAVAALDAQTGHLHAAGNVGGTVRHGGEFFKGLGDSLMPPARADAGGASRFFATFEPDPPTARFRYGAKASRAEREAGLAGFDEADVFRGAMPDNTRCRGCGLERAARDQGAASCSCAAPEFEEARDTGRANVHPTVKPLAIMRWLVRLVTPPGGRVLDPFCGSGSTGCAAMLEGVAFVGIEREEEYAAIAEARIAWWQSQPEGVDVERALQSDVVRQRRERAGQLDLLGGGGSA